MLTNLSEGQDIQIDDKDIPQFTNMLIAKLHDKGYTAEQLSSLKADGSDLSEDIIAEMRSLIDPSGFFLGDDSLVMFNADDTKVSVQSTDNAKLFMAEVIGQGRDISGDNIVFKTVYIPKSTRGKNDRASATKIVAYKKGYPNTPLYSLTSKQVEEFDSKTSTSRAYYQERIKALKITTESGDVNKVGTRDTGAATQRKEKEILASAGIL